MNKTILQIPISVELRKKAEMEALEQGFSSLQEAIRVFLNKFASKRMSVTFEETEEAIQLSEKAIKRYNKISEDFKKGRNIYTAKDVDDLMKQLHERSLP